MAIDILTLALARSYTKSSLVGLGALRGANCTIKSIVETASGSTVTFEWTGTDGSTQTSQLNIENGKDGQDGIDGNDGFSPVITESANNDATNFQLDIETKNGNITTPNLMGQSGKDGASVTKIEVRQVGTETHLFCTVTDADGNEQEHDAGILPDAGGQVQVDIATRDTAGIVKVGDNLEIDTDGVLSAVVGNTVIEITRADYDLLTDDERKDKVYYITDEDDDKQNFIYSDTRPTTVDAKMGDIVFNSLPEPNGFVGWVFTAFGWLGFGVIEGTRIVAYMLNDNTTFMVDDGTGTGNGTPFLYKDAIG